ncbi:uncharacterized protein DMAD_02839 [Drosophila madeirensis]|uniref:Uncharacterized protein n=1 Tax=Drosophila madeirensis TaxID=30013 RepID=A0AAU9G7A0_DROMD
MCNCCSQRQTSFSQIPYACPHCPVRDIASNCSIKRRTKPARHVPHPNQCDTLTGKWLELNRKLITTMAVKMHRSTQTIHYMLLRLLHANYAGVLQIVRKRRAYKVPISGYPDALFSTFSLFNDQGYVSLPMAPESVGKLLRMMQDYVVQMQLLNRQYKWFGNGQDQGDLVGLLGQQDELLKLLSGTFRDSDTLFIRCLLTTLLDLDLFVVFGKFTVDRKRSSMIRSLSELYAGVAGPQKPTRCRSKRTAKKIVDPETKPSPDKQNNLAIELLQLFTEHLAARKTHSDSCCVLPKSSTSKAFILPRQKDRADPPNTR